MKTILAMIAAICLYNCTVEEIITHVDTDTLYVYQTDTLYTTYNDTIYDVIVDTLYDVREGDTVYVIRIDTIYQIDTIYIDNAYNDSTLFDIYVETGNVPPDCSQILAVCEGTTDNIIYLEEEMCPYTIQGAIDQIPAGDYILKSWYINSIGNMISTQLYNFSIIGDMYVIIDGDYITLVSGD
jgi:hypothetical protein|tara:strand:- start:7191 stop:7739 length:549 start_codon:yes stop_codon:yes gene_type:complete